METSTSQFSTAQSDLLKWPLCAPSSLKLKEIKLTIILDIYTIYFKKLELSDIWHFCKKKEKMNEVMEQLSK